MSPASPPKTPKTALSDGFRKLSKLEQRAAIPQLAIGTNSGSFTQSRESRKAQHPSGCLDRTVPSKLGAVRH
jgi:hypothetical protein